MKKPRLNWTLASVASLVLLLGTAGYSQAQPHSKVPRIGYLAATSRSTNSMRLEAFRQGLREFGYIEGKNITIELRIAEGNTNRLPQFAAELARLKVDVIVSGGSTATRAAKEATSTIPIVMSQDNDPVGNGFVASLARPGGNITGLAALRSELSGKRLELLKEIVPKLSRVAAFGTSTNPGNTQSLKETQLAGKGLGVLIEYIDIKGADEIESGFQQATDRRVDAALVLASPIINSRRSQIVELAAKHRLPAIYDRRDFAEVGGLITYGVSVIDLDRRAATYVVRILKGATPSELPVEQPQKFDLMINLKTAKEVGLAIPPNVLARADRVIK